MSNPDLMLRTDRDGVAHLMLNRPAAYNALSLPLMQALIEALDAIDQTAGCKTVVISGAGRGFCAGHDLAEVRALNDPQARRTLFDTCSALMLRITSLRQPVIAQVHGVATAAGCQLVATCDLAIAAEDARFATPGVNIGLFCSTPMVALSRAVHRKQAMEMLLTGELVSAARAAEIGLINRSVPADALAQEVAKVAANISAKSGRVLAIGKNAFHQQIEMDVQQAYSECSRIMTENLALRDADEGITAFLEKRPPQWQDT